ncbi:MAG: hypothetical protein ACM3JD_08880 [Rudaea sp.]
MKILIRSIFFFMLVLLASVACGSAPATPAPTLPAASPSAFANAPASPAAPVHPTATPSTSPAAVPTATPSPAPPTAAPSPTRAPALVQLTSGGCCVQPFWSRDSKRVLFIDKPNAQSPTGIYSVNVDAPGEPQLVSEEVANSNQNGTFSVGFEGTTTVVTRAADGAKWLIDNGRRGVMISPEGKQVAWNVTPQTYPFENRVTTVMLGALAEPAQGQPLRITPTRVTTVTRGGASAWLDEGHLLVTGRLTAGSEVVTLFVLDLATKSTRNVASSERLRSVSVSPGGRYIVYTIVFDKDPAQSGGWLVPADGSGPAAKLPFFGAFQWRDESRIVYVPLDVGAPSHQFREYDAASDADRPLTDPAALAFMIGNGDWAVSPDGQKVVFVSAKDWNLWLVDLP